jgi:UDP-N-acetylglucosamine 1-carboxyvinyltransferase
MKYFEVEGGRKLQGEIIPQGAKNEALQIVCAVLLTDEEVIINNLPDIRDVNFLIDLLEAMGVKINRISRNQCAFKADAVNVDYMLTEDYKKRASALRGSVMVLGPLLSRYKKAYMPKPGGDRIGRRPIDTHLIGFESLGATFEYNDDSEFFKINAQNLKGNYILLEEPSVTGTANIIMAAVMAQGTTTIYNAGCEPYIQQLCLMLNSMGAQIQGVGSNLLTIKGVDILGGCHHTILPDMIEIGSFIGMAAITESDITIKNCRIDQLGLIPNVFKKMGIQFDFIGDDIHIPSQDHYTMSKFIDGSILTIYDHPWPGFTPDLLSIILVTAIQARGSVLIHQKMFESRLFFVDKLKDMGAQITLCDPHRAIVIGLDKAFPLRAITMSSPDIRAGVALLIAALSAKGTSIIHNIEQIDRGYQNIDTRLNAIGANIKRI